MCDGGKLVRSRISLSERRVAKKAVPGVYARYYPGVKGYIREHIGDSQDAEDLAQEALLTACKHRPNDPQAYILAVAKNLVNRHRRDQAKKRRATARPLCAGLDMAPDAKGGRPVSAKQLKKIIARRDIRMSAKLREALELRFIKRLSCDEAAQKIGCSKWAFYKRFERAKKALKEALTAGSSPPSES